MASYLPIKLRPVVRSTAANKAIDLEMSSGTGGEEAMRCTGEVDSILPKGTFEDEAEPLATLDSGAVSDAEKLDSVASGE
jgi:hypothetical protein